MYRDFPRGLENGGGESMRHLTDTEPREKMVVISFHCDLALKKELEHHAKKLGWKRNFLIRECLRNYLAMVPESDR